MPRSTQQTKVPSRSGITAAEPPEIERLVEELDGMLSRLRLGAIQSTLSHASSTYQGGCRWRSPWLPRSG